VHVEISKRCCGELTIIPGANLYDCLPRETTTRQTTPNYTPAGKTFWIARKMWLGVCLASYPSSAM
jgi:hypothetical protein